MIKRTVEALGTPREVWLILLAALLLRIVVALMQAADPVNAARFLPDDAYYYFIPARSWVEGHGVTFSDGMPTNGFHPLWFALLIPVFALGGPQPILLALCLEGLLSAAAAYVLWWTARRLTRNETAAGIVLILCAFNPYLVSVSLNGLETGVHMLCVALLLAWTVHLFEGAARYRRAWLVFGALSGLCFLSRTDAVILIGLLGTALFLGRPDIGRVVRLALAGLAAGGIALPWLAWNFSTFGQILQSSGTSLTRAFQIIVQVTAPGVNPIRDLAMMTASSWGDALRLAGFSLPFALALALGLPRLRRHIGQSGLRWLLIGPLYLAIYIGFHGVVRWLVRDWYYASVIAVLYIPLGVMTAAALQAFRPSRWLQGVFAAMLLLAAWAGDLSSPVFAFWGVKHPDQFQMRAAGLWARDNLAAEARIGIFNAGIFTYFNRYGAALDGPRSTQSIVNLDGVMNYDAGEAIGQRALLCYALQINLTHLADYPSVLKLWEPLFSARLPLPDDWLKPVYQADPHNGSQDYRIAAIDADRARAFLTESGIPCGE